MTVGDPGELLLAAAARVGASRCESVRDGALEMFPAGGRRHRAGRDVGPRAGEDVDPALPELRAPSRQHSVLLFRGQPVDVAAHLWFANPFGPVEDRANGANGGVAALDAVGILPDDEVGSTALGCRYCRPAMGHRHSKDEMLAAAAEVARADGLAGLTFAKVAARLGTSDRMVVYYFPTKAVLEEEVALALGADLMAVLDRAFGSERRDVDELFRTAWTVLAAPGVDPTFRLFLELIGQANARRAPYDRLARDMLQLWSAWLAERVAGSTDEQRRSAALALIARIDGLLLLRLTLGPAEAQRAFEEMTAGPAHVAAAGRPRAGR